MSRATDKNRYVVVVEENGHIRTSTVSTWGDATSYARQEWQSESVSAVRVVDTFMNRTWEHRPGSLALHC